MKTLTKLGLAASAVLSAATVQAVEDNFDVKFGGRFMFDAALVDSSDDANITLENFSGSEFRRVRLFAKGKGTGPNFSGFGFKIQLDFEEDKEVDLEDVFLSYDIHKNGIIKFGQFKQYFGLEELTSSKYLDFMERANASNSVNLARRRGIGYMGWNDNTTWAIGFYSQESGNDTEAEGIGYSARGTFAPVKTSDSVIHFGIATAIESARGSDTSRVRYRTGYHVMQNRVVGNFANDVEAPVRFGLEFAGVWGPLKVQSEYFSMKFDEAVAGGQDASLSNYYINFLYTWGGKSMASTYKQGKFGRLKANKVWQFGLRYDMVNVENARASSTMGATGDLETRSITLGANYLFNPKVKFMTNLVFVESEFDVDNDIFQDDTVLQFRLQFDF